MGPHPVRRVALGVTIAIVGWGTSAVATAAADAPAAAQTFVRPELRIARAVSTPLIDGVLNDETWRQPPLDTGEWLSYAPLNGDRVPQSTTVWLTYDDEYLYFAFKCDDPEPDRIKTSVTRRDNAFQDDWVAVSLDALGTGQIAYHMFVNPNGMQMDALNSAATGEDFAPDWIWDSAGHLTDTGYAVEMRLPLQSIRVRGGANTRMGIMFFRRVSRSGVSVAWPPMPAGQWVFDRHASALFERLSTRRVRELLPSATFSVNGTRESPARWRALDRRADVGISAKLGLTSTVTLDATLNPDFSQVESDAFQVEVNQRFPVFYGEKRPFFMEGAGVFALSSTGAGDGSLRVAVHTRRIVDPIFGAKVTGSVGRMSFGGLSAVDEAGEHDRLFTIGRAQYSVAASSYFGALFTDTSSSVEGNRAGGADINWRLTPTQRVSGYALLSGTNDGSRTRSGGAGQVSYGFENEKWSLIATGEHFGREFDMATAFINRVGFSSGSVFLNHSFYPDKAKYPWLRRFMLLTYDRVLEDRLQGGREVIALGGLQFHFSRQGFLRVERYWGYEPWQQQRFNRDGSNAFGFVQLFRWLAVNGGARREHAILYDLVDPFAGTAHDSNIGLTFQPNGRLAQDIAVQHVTFDHMSTGARVYTVDLVNTKTTYQFTRALAVRGIAQYDSSRRRVLTDFLASYEPRPGTVVYAGYGSLIEQRDFVNGHWIPRTGRYYTTRRGLFFKASYLYRF